MKTVLERGHALGLHGDVAELDSLLGLYVSHLTRAAILDCALRRVEGTNRPSAETLRSEVVAGLRLFVSDQELVARCVKEVMQLAGRKSAAPPPPSTLPPPSSRRSSATSPLVGTAMHVSIRIEEDVVRAKRAMRHVAAEVGFSEGIRHKLCEAIGELANNALLHAGAGEIELQPLLVGQRGVHVVVVDFGPGIPRLHEILAARSSKPSGANLGLRGIRDSVDSFDVQTANGEGTRVTFRKYLLVGHRGSCLERR